MLNYLSTKSTIFLFKKSAFPSSEKPIYIYGFCLLYSSCFIIMSILVISSILNHIIYGIYFLLFFIPLRTYTGGYHSNTYGGCFIISNLYFIFSYFIAQILLTVYSIPNMVITLFISVYIYINCPIINSNHVIPVNLLPVYKHKAGILLIIIIFIILFLLVTGHLDNLSRMAIATIITVALLIYISTKERKNKWILKTSANLLKHSQLWEPETHQHLLFISHLHPTFLKKCIHSL